MRKGQSRFDIYLSDECREDKIVVKGNNLKFRWIGDGIIVYRDENDVVNVIERMENERSRMVKLLQSKGVHNW
jgi:hypothetical protein